MGPVFLNANRNKRSVVLDLKQPAGLEALRKLLVDADVLIYNVRPQAMERLGLGYEAVAAINPRIVYAGLFGFGQEGPYAARPAYDDLIQGDLAEFGVGLVRGHALAIDLGEEAALVREMALLGFVCGALLGAEFQRRLLAQGFVAGHGFVQRLAPALRQQQVLKRASRPVFFPLLGENFLQRTQGRRQRLRGYRTQPLDQTHLVYRPHLIQQDQALGAPMRQCDTKRGRNAL
jgi:CoA-transferase family III